MSSRWSPTPSNRRPRRPAIDVALGPLAQYLIVRGDSLQRAILSGDLGLEGRVGLLRIDELPLRRPGDRIRLDGLKGVVGRADRMVRVDTEFEAARPPSARHDLVRRYPANGSWASQTERRRVAVCHRRCELLERDGSIMRRARLGGSRAWSAAAASWRRPPKTSSTTATNCGSRSRNGRLNRRRRPRSRRSGTHRGAAPRRGHRSEPAPKPACGTRSNGTFAARPPGRWQKSMPR